MNDDPIFDLLRSRARPETTLAVSWSVEGDHLVAGLSGEIDAATARQLPDAVLAVLGGEPVVVVDLAEVTFLDSSLLGALVHCRAELAERGVECRVRNPAPQARRILEIASLEFLLDIS